MSEGYPFRCIRTCYFDGHYVMKGEIVTGSCRPNKHFEPLRGYGYVDPEEADTAPAKNVKNITPRLKKVKPEVKDNDPRSNDDLRQALKEFGHNAAFNAKRATMLKRLTTFDTAKKVDLAFAPVVEPDLE